MLCKAEQLSANKRLWRIYMSIICLVTQIVGTTRTEKPKCLPRILYSLKGKAGHSGRFAMHGWGEQFRKVTMLKWKLFWTDFNHTTNKEADENTVLNYEQTCTINKLLYLKLNESLTLFDQRKQFYDKQLNYRNLHLIHSIINTYKSEKFRKTNNAS